MRRSVAVIGAMVVAAALWPAICQAGVYVVTKGDGPPRILNSGGSFSLGLAQRVPQGLSSRRTELWPHVEEIARSQGVDPNLVDLVIRMESGYNAGAVSRKGARGVMQLMPTTASLYGVKNAFDARENIRGGVSYLRDLMERFDSDVTLALAAYNAGPEAVAKHGGVPPYQETRNYVSSILTAYSGGVGPVLSGGFGKPRQAARPVQLWSEVGPTGDLQRQAVRRGGGRPQAPAPLSSQPHQLTASPPTRRVACACAEAGGRWP